VFLTTDTYDSEMSVIIVEPARLSRFWRLLTTVCYVSIALDNDSR